MNTKKFGIARINDRVKLISITPNGRLGQIIADVKEGFEGNIPAALAACENNNLAEGQRIFLNKP